MLDMIEEAKALAQKQHEGQTKAGGRTMFDHVQGIVEFLKKYEVDEVTLSAAYLHDVVEDTSITHEEIKNKFGPEISLIVDGLTHDQPTSSGEGVRAYVSKLENAIQKDRRVLLIKIADLADNTQNLRYAKKEKKLKKQVWFYIFMGFVASQAKTQKEKDMVDELCTRFNTYSTKTMHQ